ncbi:MAG: non-homologous end-joining DNA ligase [Mycobacteriales bacterium]
MLATTGPLPSGPEWAYELKWDGVRVLADIGPEGLRMTGRSEREVTIAYPELHGLADVCDDALLDGEVVALTDGRPSFAALQPRMHVRSAGAAAALATQAPVTYLVFDILRLYGVDLTRRPYAERRATLERLGLDATHWATPPVFDDGVATVQACRDQQLEGVVAKRLSSTYHFGVRTREWVKLKITHEQEFVVGGWQPGSGGRAGTIGSLALGYHDGGVLRYAGQVGSGLAGGREADLRRRLDRLRRDDSPFADRIGPRQVRWCEPTVVVQVRFAEWTPTMRLRFPVFLGVRDDVDPWEVVRE